MHEYTKASSIKGIALIPLDVNHYKYIFVIFNMTW